MLLMPITSTQERFEFGIKKLGEYRELYGPSNTLLLADVFENFQRKKTRPMLLLVEKGIRGGICHAIHQYPKVNTKYMKDRVKIRSHDILCIGA